MTYINRFFITTLSLLLLSTTAMSEDALTALELQQQWDHANFEISDKKLKASALKSLSDNARISATQSPNDADVQSWAGIVLSTYAGEAGLSALSLVKEAKKYFEKAIEIDPRGMGGSAYTSLGSLYYQVPGWPIGFGDEDKAATFLNKGLELDPNGIDANYFYADFLLHQKKYGDAVPYLEKVIAAVRREGRASADAGRKAQAVLALEKARNKMR